MGWNTERDGSTVGDIINYILKHENDKASSMGLHFVNPRGGVKLLFCKLQVSLKYDVPIQDQSQDQQVPIQASSQENLVSG